MNRTDRLYAMAEELRAAGRQGRTSAQLASQFEISGRTVKRDVSALQQAGVPIWAESGPGGGYVLDAAASLPPLNLTAAEATAISLALAAMPQMPFAPDGKAALTKVMAAMPAAERDRAAALGRRLWIRQREATSRPALSRTLEEALRQQVVVVLDYQNRDGTMTRRRAVEPMAFAATGGRWYLLAWCRSRRAGRWFRLDRVVGATLTHEPAPDRDLVRVFGTPPPDAGPVVLPGPVRVGP